MGQAAGQAALEAFGGTDLGIPLISPPRVVLVPSVISQFSAGLDVPAEEVHAFVALREAAHVRLFNAAPWLAGQLSAAIERYAAGITIDLDALDEAVSRAGAGDPAALQQALTRGIFASHHTEEQAATLEGLASAHGILQARVARELRLKRTPALEFTLDDTAQRAAKLEALIEDVTEDGSS